MVFCDECNLPKADKYGTQQVILWIRQAIEYGGFYRPADKEWVKLERVLFLGACNPPEDAGRYPMWDPTPWNPVHPSAMEGRRSRVCDTISEQTCVEASS